MGITCGVKRGDKNFCPLFHTIKLIDHGLTQLIVVIVTADADWQRRKRMNKKKRK